MIPILYPKDEINFTTNGLGKLSDCINPNIHEERNGEYEFEMDYPVDGQHYAELDDQMIILAKPNPYMQTQPFRIYNISRPMNGIVSISARHVSSDLSGVVVTPFSAATVAASFAQMKANSTPAIPQFTFSTDKTTTSTMWVKKPSSFKSLLGGVQGSILDSFGGGEYTFNRFNVRLETARGEDRGFSIRYGKNLVSLQQNQNCENVYTAVYPFYYSGDTLVDLGTTIDVEGTFDFNRVLSLDLTDKFDDVPTVQQLRVAAIKYINDNNIGKPKVNLKVDFVKLSQYSGYEEFEPLEDIRLCDTVSIFFEKLGVSTSAKCIAMDFNPLTERITSIELGDAKNTLADTIADQSKAIKDQGNIDSKVGEQISRATQLITGNKGGHLLIWNSDTRLPEYPNELLIMDKETVASSTKIWRFNKSGWGYSSNGYNGPFNLAATMEGEINADFIKAGKITGIEINNGNGTFKVDSSGNLTANNATLKGSFQAARTKIDTSGNFVVTNSSNAEIFKISSTGAMKGGALKVSASGGLSVGTGTSYSTSDPFYVTPSGVLHATGAVITGSLKAGTMSIDTSGNLTVKDSNNADLFKISSTGALKAGALKVTSSGAMSVGSQTNYSTSDPFYVTAAGALHATGATITGSLKAGTMSIDTSGNLTVKDSNNNDLFKISSAGALKAGRLKVNADGAMSVGTQGSYSTSDPFYVTKEGVLHANGAVLKGSFTAENTSTGYKVQLANDGLLHFFYNGTDYGQMYCVDGSLWIKYDEAYIRLFYNPTNNTIQMNCGDSIMRIEHVSNQMGQTMDQIFMKAGDTMFSMGNDSVSIVSGGGYGFRADSSGAYALLNGTAHQIA